MQPTIPRSMPQLEALENRTHLSGAPLNVTTVATDQGAQLQIIGTYRSNIFVRETDGDIVVRDADGWIQSYPDVYSSILIRAGTGATSITVRPTVTLDTTIYGGPGNATLQSGSGNDQIYAGKKNNLITCGSGNDTVVTLGAGSAVINAGPGNDSFWLNNTPSQTIRNLTAAQTAAGEVHRVAGFANGQPASSATTTTPASGVAAPVALPEPAVTDSQIQYHSFAGDPLFSSTGPSPDDVKQGYVGDCYYLATLSAIAQTDPNLIRQSVVELSDGTFVVQFIRNNSAVFVRVDAQLPTWSWGTPAYAALGQQNSLWVAIMEKAYACFRTSDASYASLDGGWMSEAYQALGESPVNTFTAASATALLGIIQQELASGMAVTYATGEAPAGSPLIDDHAYMVDSVICDANGQPVALRLRNPWGFDANGDGNGYLTVTAQQALDAFLGLVAAPV